MIVRTILFHDSMIATMICDISNDINTPFRFTQVIIATNDIAEESKKLPKVVALPQIR